MHAFPKQMRYQAALLPDGGFPRGSGLTEQLAFGTKRNRAAHHDTLVPAIRDTKKAPPGGNPTRPK
jgi:hypothetical protein